MPNQVNIEQNIRILRANQDMTQEQLAAKLNIKRQTISKWEKGQVRPDLETILMLAEIFQVSVDELIGGKIESILKTADPQKIKSMVAEKQANRKHKGDTPLPNTTSNSERTDSPMNSIFPYSTTENIESLLLFTKALEAHEASLHSKDSDSHIEAVHLYHEAFEHGLLDAAVNLLSIIVGSIVNYKEQYPGAPLPFQDKLNIYLDALEAHGHPAGQYYRALSMMLGVLENESTDDENFDEGLQLMEAIAVEGNDYAINYFRFVEENAEETQ